MKTIKYQNQVYHKTAATDKMWLVEFEFDEAKFVVLAPDKKTAITLFLNDKEAMGEFEAEERKEYEKETHAKELKQTRQNSKVFGLR